MFTARDEPFLAKADNHDVARNARAGPSSVRSLFRDGRRLRPTLIQRKKSVLYLTGVLTIAALVYLAYVMIRPEKF